jgi:NADH-quinone oxidoreductase subunit E
MALTEEARARLAPQAAEIIGRYPRARSALLPLLHLVQSEEGYVSEDGIAFCAEQLGLTEADVTGVVSYYTMYKRKPVGEYHIGVCTNALCAVMGGDAIFSDLKDYLDVDVDEPTPDGKVSFEHVECNAGCDYAPVVMVNWEFFDNMTPAKTRDLVDRLRSGENVPPSRGAPVQCTWKQAGQILAGFPDDQATGGHTAEEPTLAGLRIAKAAGWTPDDGPANTGNGPAGASPAANGSSQ